MWQQQCSCNVPDCSVQCKQTSTHAHTLSQTLAALFLPPLTPFSTCQIGKPKVKQQQQPQPRILPKPNKLWLPCQISKNRKKKPGRKNLQQKVFHSVFITFCFGFHFSLFLFFFGILWFTKLDWMAASKKFWLPGWHTYAYADSPYLSHSRLCCLSLAQYKWPPWRFAAGVTWRRKICNKIYFHRANTHTPMQRYSLCQSCCVAYVVQHFRFRFAQANAELKRQAKLSAKTSEKAKRGARKMTKFAL